MGTVTLSLARHSPPHPPACRGPYSPEVAEEPRSRFRHLLHHSHSPPTCELARIKSPRTDNSLTRTSPSSHSRTAPFITPTCISPQRKVGITLSTSTSTHPPMPGKLHTFLPRVRMSNTAPRPRQRRDMAGLPESRDPARSPFPPCQLQRVSDRRTRLAERI